MRLEKIQEFMKKRGMPYQYFEEADCGSIEFIHRGLSYHIWEYPREENSADSNVRTVGRMEAYFGDYEEQIIAEMSTW